ALQHNFATIRDYVSPQAAVCAVVKANAYGHGAARCALALQGEGAKWFGVSGTEEGAELRRAGVTGRILLLSGFWHGEEEAVLEYNLTPAVWDWNHIELLENAAEKMDRAPESVAVHLKLDTGMTRLGVSLADLPTMAQVFQEAQFVMLEGVFTHLASAEVLDAPDVDAQIQRFEDAVNVMIEQGLSPLYYHMANSAAIVTQPRARKNMVRPGISLYGYYLPFSSIISHAPDSSHELPVKPVLSWKTRILSLRDVGARQPVGYNGAYVTQAPARIAALPVGYADGLSRQLSSKGRVIVRDDYAAIVGNISMDITLIDVTGIPGVEVGDEVILIGSQGRRSITAWDHASLAMTIPYEILTGLSKRLPRRYVE
ncbi:MAG: alanine racemase, partial [Terriglobales bacterium]